MSDVDVIDKPQAVAKQEPISIKISFPDVFTLDHWQTYSNGRAEYTTKCESDGSNPDNLIGKYFGALALIKAGFVHIEGLAQLMEATQSLRQGATSLQVITFIVVNVANRAEAAINYPSLWQVI